MSPREDRVKTLNSGVQLILKYKSLVDKLAEHSEEIDKNLKGYNFTDNINLMTEILFKI